MAPLPRVVLSEINSRLDPLGNQAGGYLAACIDVTAPCGVFRFEFPSRIANA